MKAQVQAALGTLEARQARIIALRFGLTGGGGQRLEAVAKACGMARERTRRIEVEAMAKLRDQSRSGLLRDYHSGD